MRGLRWWMLRDSLRSADFREHKQQPWPLSFVVPPRPIFYFLFSIFHFSFAIEENQSWQYQMKNRK